jgi:hypothetical protein
VFSLLVSLQYDHRKPDSKVVRTPHKEPLRVAAAAVEKPAGEGPLKVAKGRSPNLEGFNETAYIITGHRDKDSYKLNAFNQAESDLLASDRGVPDTRNYQ